VRKADNLTTILGGESSDQDVGWDREWLWISCPSRESNSDSLATESAAYPLHLLSYPISICAFDKIKVNVKVVLLQAWSGPEGSRKLSFPDFKTLAQDGGKVVSLTRRPPLPPGTHFC